MHSPNAENRYRQFIYPEAALKHILPCGSPPRLRWEQTSISISELVHSLNQAQGETWRTYAKAKHRRNRGPSRAGTA